MKYLAPFVLIILCGTSAIAQNDAGPPGSAMTLEQLKEKSSDQREKRSRILEVSPAAEPIPALRYRFRPAVWEKKPTRAMLHYMRANTNLLERVSGLSQKYESEEWQKKDHPDGPTPQELAEAVEWLESVFDEMHQLALSEDFSWDHRIRDLRGVDVYNYLLSDVQQARRFARFFNLKVRHQLNQDDIDGAIESIHDGLRLAEFVSNDEFAIQQLVAIAISAITSEQIYHLIEHPDSPNLYWALAALPRPLVKAADSVQLELHVIHQVLPMFREAETEVWSEQEAQAAWSTMMESLKATGALTDNAFADAAMTLTALGVTQAKPARNDLQSQGFTDERLAQMPDLQCVLADASLEITRMSDEMMKGLLLPDPISGTFREKAAQQYQEWARTTPPTVGSIIGAQLMPAVMQMKEAERRTYMRFNRLMTLEAIRMHVAGHNGELPKSLNDLSPVPAMPDPYTGEHFDYRLEEEGNDQVIVLEAAGPTNYLPLKELRFRFR